MGERRHFALWPRWMLMVQQCGEALERHVVALAGRGTVDHITIVNDVELSIREVAGTEGIQQMLRGGEIL